MAQRYYKTAVSSRLEGLPAVQPDTASGVKVAITASAVASAPLTGGLYYVCPSVACYVSFGGTASSGASSMPFFGAAQVPFVIADGDAVSVIRLSEDGSLWLIPCAEG